MKRVIVSPAAEIELAAAAQWYSEQQSGLGEALVLEVGTTLQALAEHSHLHPAWRAGQAYRKAPVHRFPFVVFYTYDDKRVDVLAIAHQRRKPGYWIRR